MDYSVEIVGKETVKVHRQLYRVVLGPTCVFLMIAAAIMGICFLILALTAQDFGNYTLEFCLFIFILAFSMSPAWLGSLSYRKKLKYYSGAMPEGVFRFGEKILMEDSDSYHVIPYDKIKKIVITDDCIVLRLADTRAIGIPKGPFTKGSLQELLQLFHEKCPQAKLPDWK